MSWFQILVTVSVYIEMDSGIAETEAALPEFLHIEVYVKDIIE